MFQAVIFDLDGTLLDTIGDLAAAGNHALVSCGLATHTVEEFKQFVGDGRRNMVLRMLPPEQAADEAVVLRAEADFDEYYHAHMLDTTAPFPGIAELLGALKEQNLKLGVVSNKPDEFVQKIVQDYFPGIFDVVCGQQGDVLKPDPSSVNRVLKQLHLRPHQALYVGDSGVDVATADNAHCPCCAVTWGFRTRKELLGAAYIIDTPLELTAIAMPAPTGKSQRVFAVIVVGLMVLCLLGVVYSLAVGNMAAVAAGIIFPVILGFAATKILKK